MIGLSSRLIYQTFLEVWDDLFFFFLPEELCAADVNSITRTYLPNIV